MRAMLCFTLVLLVFSSPFSRAQWQGIGPSGGEVTAVAAYNSHGVNYIFAGTNSGLYRSTDNGSTWTAATPGFPPTSVNVIKASYNLLLAAPFGTGLYRSRDNGATWSKVTTAGLSNNVVTGAAFDSNIVVATTAGAGVFVSTDTGSSWSAANKGLSNLNVSAPFKWSSAHTSDSAFLYTMFAVFGYRVKGDSATLDTIGLPQLTSPTPGSPGWNEQRSKLLGPVKDAEVVFGSLGGGPHDRPAAEPSGTFVFAAAFNGVFRSTDFGLIWDQRSPAPFPTGLAVRDSEVYAGYLNTGVYSSTDYGSTWHSDTVGLPNFQVEGVAASDSGIYAATDDGVARHTAPGSSWSNLSSALCVQHIVGLFSDGKNLYGASQNLSHFRSTDGGTTWLRDQEGLFGWIRTYTSDSSFLYAGEGFGGGAYRSSDQGMHWQQIDSGLIAGDIAGLLMHRGRLYAAAENGTVFVSADHGDHWTLASNGLPVTSANIGLRTIGAVDSVLFVTMTPGVYRSTDQGQHWVPSDTSFHFGGIVQALQQSGGALYAGLAGEGVYKTSDHGLSWVAANSGIKTETVNALASAGNMIYAGTESGKIFGSANGGNSWMDLSQGFPGIPVLLLVVQGNTLYAGTLGGSVWKRPLSEITVAVGPAGLPSLPADFRLFQSYPNPFNPATIIRYALPRRTHVTLTVFNVLGQSVAKLVNANVDAGTHEVRFEARSLASGVYFYRIQAGDFLQTRSILFLR